MSSQLSVFSYQEGEFLCSLSFFILALLAAVSALEWKPKPPTPSVVVEHVSPETSPKEETGRSSPPIASLMSNEVPAEAISKLEGLNLLDDRPVIIPEHLQVPEAECAGLNFGSFDTDFELSFSTGPNDTKSLAVEEVSASLEVLPVEPIESRCVYAEIKFCKYYCLILLTFSLLYCLVTA